MLKLNLILNGLVSSLDHAVQGDTLSSPYHRSDDNTELRQFSFVVSNPPFKMDFSDSREKLAAMTARFWGGIPKVPAKDKSKMAIYTLFIQHVLNSIKNGGKGAIVVPTGFLTAKTGVENTVLQKLVDDRVISGVVSMPSNVFANTGTNVSVLFFDKSSANDHVVLIDASKMGEDYKDSNLQKRRLRLEEITQIVEAFRERKAIDDFSVVVPYEDIKEKNYSLAAGQYFDVKIEYVYLTEQEFQSKLSEYSQALRKQFKHGEELQAELIQRLDKA
jgi:type I restriction enzyme M protein